MMHARLVYHYIAQLDTDPLPRPTSNAVETGMQIVLGIIGAASMLVIVISGFRYIIASGDPGQMAQAKKAIVYALVGLAVSLAAFSIVTFVVKGLG